MLAQAYLVHPAGLSLLSLFRWPTDFWEGSGNPKQRGLTGTPRLSHLLPLEWTPVVERQWVRPVSSTINTESLLGRTFSPQARCCWSNMSLCSGVLRQSATETFVGQRACGNLVRHWPTSGTPRWLGTHWSSSLAYWGRVKGYFHFLGSNFLS